MGTWPTAARAAFYPSSAPGRHPAAGTPLYNERGQVVGAIGDDGFLTKAVTPALHQLRHPPAWAVDAAHLDELARLEAVGVRLMTHRGERWEAPLAAFARFGFVVDRGHGVQVALPLARWHREAGATHQLALPLPP